MPLRIVLIEGHVLTEDGRRSMASARVSSTKACRLPKVSALRRAVLSSRRAASNSLSSVWTRSCAVVSLAASAAAVS